MQVCLLLILMGWMFGGKFIFVDWKGYNEGKLVYILVLGLFIYLVDLVVWKVWLFINDIIWGSFYGQIFFNFVLLFGYQYIELWVDFCGICDDWNCKYNFDYFENGCCVIYSQCNYVIVNFGGWIGYGKDVWGLIVSNGLGGFVVKSVQGEKKFQGYIVCGVGLDYIFDDGIIVLIVVGGLIVFVLEIVIFVLVEMKQCYGKYIYDCYGFVDVFNFSFYIQIILCIGKLVFDLGWVDIEQLGIDQGLILLMIENWCSGFVWNVMKKNLYICCGLQCVGFIGGWLVVFVL